MEEEKKRLLRILKNLSYEEGDFTLTSGKKSTFYIDCKETTLNPEGMYLVGHLMYIGYAKYQAPKPSGA